MTTDAEAADQDHLRDAARRQRGAPRRVRGRPLARVASRRSAARHRELRRRRVARRRRARSRSARRSTRDIVLGTFAKGTRGRRRRGRRRRPARAARLGRRRRGASALAILERAARPDQRAADGLLRAHGHRGRQEPDRGARRGRGIGRPHPLLRLRRWRTTTATTTRWATSATRPSTPARSCGRTASSRSSARSTSRWRWRPVRPAPRCWPATRSSSSRSSASPLSAVKLLEAYIDAGVPAGVVNLVMGPGETVGQALQDHPGVDGIVFTGSYEVGMRLFHSFSKTWPRPCDRRDGRQEPGDRRRAPPTSTRRPRGSCARAFGFGGQKCSANSRVYVERPVHDELVRLLVEKTEAITIGDPLRPRELAGPDHRPEGGRPAPGRRLRGAPRRDGVRRRRAADRRRPRARLLRRADRGRRAAGRRTASSATSCSRRSPRSLPSTRSTRRSRSPTTRSTA